jgi:diphthamide synthase (EF-2-diphthine--ammonia ligase)
LETVLVSWSGGKDSCPALYELLLSREYEVAALLTTGTRDYDRVQLHVVRRDLLESQAESPTHSA